MTARVEIWPDAEDKWRWHVIAANELITADSGQGYSTKSNARRAWRRFEASIRAGIEVRDV